MSKKEPEIKKKKNDEDDFTIILDGVDLRKKAKAQANVNNLYIDKINLC